MIKQIIIKQIHQALINPLATRKPEQQPGKLRAILLDTAEIPLRQWIPG